MDILNDLLTLLVMMMMAAGCLTGAAFRKLILISSH